MKILVNALQSRSGGALAYLKNMLPLMNEWPTNTGIDLHILGYQSQFAMAFPQGTDLACTLHEASVPWIARSFKNLALPKKLAKQLDADVVFTPYQVAAIHSRSKTVAMLRNMEPFYHWNYSSTTRNRIRNIALQHLSMRTFRSSSLVISVSTYTTSFLEKAAGLPKSRIVQINHGRDPIFSPSVRPHDAETLSSVGLSPNNYIFTSGSILPYRRLEDIIAAFLQSNAAHNYQLVIAGSGNDAKYQKRLEKLASAPPARKGCIKFLGQVPHALIPSLYRNCRLFITASEVEACPNTVIEALSSGCKTLACDKCYNKEILGDSAHYFRCRNIKQLTSSIDSTIARPPNSADPTTLSRYSWRLCSSKTFSALMSLL